MVPTPRAYTSSASDSRRVNQSTNYLDGLITIIFYFELKHIDSNHNINNFFSKIKAHPLTSLNYYEYKSNNGNFKVIT